MSLQVCHCGWSKMTTYQGLRTHQGKMGCTQKGMRIPENEQFSYIPKFTNMGTPIRLEEPVIDFLGTSVKPEINTSTMSLQVCHCGWSKMTTYQGLRTHQGKMGCTQKGMRIPENEQFSYIPKFTNMGTPIRLEEPVIDFLGTSVKPEINTSTMSLQVCHCGWSKMTTYQGLRTHQGKMGCTQKGMRIPENEQFSYFRKFTNMGTPIRQEEPVIDFLDTSVKPDAKASPSDMGLQSLRNHQREIGGTLNGLRIPESEQNLWTHPWDNSRQDDSKPLSSATVKEEPVLMPALQSITTQMSPAATENQMESNKSLVENQQHSLQMGANLDKTHPTLGFTAAAQSVLMPASQTITTSMNPAAGKTPMKETNKSFFETPQHSHQTTNSSSDKARRALDFSTGAQQAQKLWEVPTSTAPETAIQLKQKELEKEREKEREREAQKLLKARQDRMRADLQQKIQTREHKVAEVRSSVKAYKGGLDAEWLEINSVFTEVMKIVEDAKQEALQPLEQRRKKAKREAQDLIQKLQREIDILKKSIDELDTKPDLQVSPLTGLNESWKNVSVETSHSFGTLRTTTSVMMKEIQEQLENLSSVELKRIPTFAVDVKLDPTTAHQCLVLSADGKKVQDGGQTPKVPDTPKRFDAFGSILGLNSFTSGKSYWEVEVTNKTGWDLGVARGSANRKGKLTLYPDNGYWVTVHYEDKKYAALTAPPISLSLKEKPQKVGVFVDYEEGLVSFYNVTTQSHIYSFTECAFSEPIFPYFSPHLKQNGKNADPLIISAVHNQQ